jgi:hypothetical protein
MVNQLMHLHEDEVNLMLKAPVLVAILIAGADGQIDDKEIREAISYARQKREAGGLMTEYFKEVFHDFEDKLKITLQGYPHETTQRMPLLIDELTSVGAVLNRIDKAFAKNVYDTLIEIAVKVATSSGGILGMKKVSAEEAKYINLPMIKDPSKIS